MKTITWRLMATLTTVLLVFVFTRSFFCEFQPGFSGVSVKDARLLFA